MRPLRYLVHAQNGGEATVEITARTLQARVLLKPDSHVNSIIVGVLAGGQGALRRQEPCAGRALHHTHLPLSAQSTKQLSRFMQQMMSNIARKPRRLVDPLENG